MKTPIPIVKIPENIEISLYLIGQELKSRRLFETLANAGLHDCYFQPHLDSIIMRNIGLDDSKDEIFAVYDSIMTKRSKKIEADNDSVVKQAMKALAELEEFRKSIRGGGD